MGRSPPWFTTKRAASFAGGLAGEAAVERAEWVSPSQKATLRLESYGRYVGTAVAKEQEPLCCECGGKVSLSPTTANVFIPSKPQEQRDSSNRQVPLQEGGQSAK